MTNTPIADTAMIQHFDVRTDATVLFDGLMSDGAVIVEGLLSGQVVARVNDEVKRAVAAADPDGPMFNPMTKAFHGAFTRNAAGAPGISPTFAWR